MFTSCFTIVCSSFWRARSSEMAAACTWEISAFWSLSWSLDGDNPTPSCLVASTCSVCPWLAVAVLATSESDLIVLGTIESPGSAEAAGEKPKKVVARNAAAMNERVVKVEWTWRIINLGDSLDHSLRERIIIASLRLHYFWQAPYSPKINSLSLFFFHRTIWSLNRDYLTRVESWLFTRQNRNALHVCCCFHVRKICLRCLAVPMKAALNSSGPAL